MPRRRTLFWTIAGSVVAVAAVVITLVEVSPGTSPQAASSPAAALSPVSRVPASVSPQPGKSDPVIIPRARGASSLTYVSGLTPSSSLRELVYPGAVTITGAIYPKSVSFYCNDGDLPSYPAVYKLKRNARRFEATVGLEAKWPLHYWPGVSVVGDGRTLKVFTVSVLKPKTIDVNVTGIRTLTLECFSPGMTSAADGWNVEVSWGNARVTAGH
jgi:hypothetical protein